MNSRRFRILLLTTLAMVLFVPWFSAARVAEARRAVVYRTLWIDFQATHGTYRAELFRVGASQPLSRTSNFTVSGGKHLTFNRVPTNNSYFVRFFHLPDAPDENEEVKQTGSFYLPSSPFWPQQEGPFNWYNL